MLRRLAGLAAFGLVGAVVTGGCASDRPSAEAGTGAGKGAPSIGGTDTSSKPPGCGTTDDGTQCDCLDVATYTDPPTMYFVLDHSGSMALDDKWNKVRAVVAQLMKSLGPRANFGATQFPGTSGNDYCGAGNEVLKVMPGDAPSPGNGPAVSALLVATSAAPVGGTSTAATLAAVRTRLASIAGRKFVILATDGAPNCNLTKPCDAKQCQLNIDSVNGCVPDGDNCCADDPSGCNDEAPTVAEISGLHGAGIDTFVIGLPGASHYDTTLENMAVAGGQALGSSQHYYAVSTSSQDQMYDALKQVAAKITATCDFTLKQAPKDPTLVNVYVDEVVVPYEATNGWTIAGSTVTLQGSTCARVKSGDAFDVRVILGCPRILPK